MNIQESIMNPFTNIFSEEEISKRISDIRNLISMGSRDVVTDYLYQNTDDDFNNGNFRIWQHVMQQIPTNELGSSLCRSLLVLTKYPANLDKDFKQVRADFFENAYNFVRETQGEDKAKRIFASLKGE